MSLQDSISRAERAGVDAAPPAPPAIEVDGVSASYHVRIDNANVLNDVRNLIRPSKRRANERVIPALRDVSFHVPRGSVLGVIGRNGAGKSTLLRTLAGILAPEAGRIVVRGKINLLAVGIGLRDNLTGRENIKIGGLAVGMSEARLAGITEEIAEFAQLGEYIDLPMSAYSTGMRARLAFAVAAHLDPEILLIDEALTGGDAAFQQHVGQKMADLCGQGQTIVLVSHGLSSIRTMATEALWLHHGQVVELGDPDAVVAKYMRYCRLESLSLDADDQ